MQHLSQCFPLQAPSPRGEWPITPIAAEAESPSRMSMTPPEGSNRRSTARQFLRLPAWIIFYRTNLQIHVAFVRDMSRQGIFFHSDIEPWEGDEISFVLRFPTWANSAVIACKGTVIRVEQAAPGARLGVAARLDRCLVLGSKDGLPTS